jgi:hypothetical protein
MQARRRHSTKKSNRFTPLKKRRNALLREVEATYSKKRSRTDTPSYARSKPPAPEKRSRTKLPRTLLRGAFHASIFDFVEGT